MGSEVPTTQPREGEESPRTPDAIYSCCFSPNDPFEIFENQILLFEESLSEASGRTLIVGVFNSKSPEWKKAA